MDDWAADHAQEEVFAPALMRQPVASPAAAWAHLTAAGNVLRLQSGESGRTRAQAT